MAEANDDGSQGGNNSDASSVTVGGNQAGGGPGGAPAVGPVAKTDIQQVLTWIGFPTAEQMAKMQGELGDELVEIGSLKEKDISELADSYAKRTINAGRITFGLQRIKRMKALIHWVQDFERINTYPTIAGLAQETFRDALKVAAERAAIQKEEKDVSETISHQATPGKLKDASDWDK